jgi:hypothetical protein
VARLSQLSLLFHNFRSAFDFGFCHIHVEHHSLQLLDAAGLHYARVQIEHIGDTQDNKQNGEIQVEIFSKWSNVNLAHDLFLFCLFVLSQRCFGENKKSGRRENFSPRVTASKADSFWRIISR